MFDDFFAKAHELTQAGVPFATALVVRAEKPTSGKPGDKAIITADGTMYGWIGGSCAQPTVVREAQRALRDDASRFIRLSPDPSQQPPREGLVDVTMSCFSGGTLEIYIEPQQPRPRLLVVGSLPVARALAVLAQAMNYHVLLADPDHMGEPPPYVSQVIADLTTLAAQINPHTAVVVASHGQYDELALEQVLPSSAFYIGLIASQRRAGAVRRHLEQQGLSAEQLRRFKAPAGLNIGARRGDEIALSVMAEIVQRRRQALEGASEAEQPLVLELKPARPVATCPVCQMAVDVGSAKYRQEYEGTTYYFCCPGCRYSFRENPAAFVHALNP